MSSIPNLRGRLRSGASRLLPPGSRPRVPLRAGVVSWRIGRDALADVRAYVRDGLVSHTLPFGYGQWLRAMQARWRPTGHLPEAAGEDFAPTFTAVVLDGEGDLGRTLLSLQAQEWPTTVVDLSSAADDLGALAFLFEEADGFVMALRCGDELEPWATARIADRALANPETVVITFDDDLLTTVGSTSPRFHPPTMCRDVLWSANPYGLSMAVRASAARAAGGLDASLGLDAFWDLLARLGPDRVSAEHVPSVLAHRHVRPPAAGPAAEVVVKAQLQRHSLAGDPVRVGDAVHVRWAPVERPRVSILVPTRHNRPLIGPLLDSLSRLDYPDWELVVVDNGGRTDENEAFYAERAAAIDHRVIWWDEPFNYGAVNNAAAAAATGDVLVLLNDDTVIRDPRWLDEMVGWLGVDGVGTVGVQLLDPQGLIQHGGAVVGAGGMADHRFQGLRPHTDTMIGSTDWYWDSSANTAACVAIPRHLWDEIGGLDERFVLCGSDVVLGLEVFRRGYRNVCTPATWVDHMESATRKTDVPVGDLFHSYWPYARSLKAGDPYMNPNVSILSREPKLRALDEPTSLELVGPGLGRHFGRGAFRQDNSLQENQHFAAVCRLDDLAVRVVEDLHDAYAGPIDVRTVNWFVPEFDNPFYGGLATIFRIAEHLRAHHGVQSRFVVWGNENDAWFRSGIQAAFPGLADSPVLFSPHIDDIDWLDGVPEADVSIATQWQTAYRVAHFRHTKRKMYLIQDFEPMFHPAGTLYALAETTYEMGLVALCNTPHLLDVYGDRYGGRGHAFTPAVDDRVFHARTRAADRGDGPLRLFVYARPGHWRNCWELAEPALREIKRRHGEGIHIITAGAWATPDDLGTGIDHLGLLDYVDTGELYRSCDLALSLTVSEHPSYLPLELMACGVPVVAFDLVPGHWILHHGENSLLARRTVDSLVERMDEMVTDEALRARLAEGGLATIAASHASWEANLAGVHEAMSAALPPRIPRRGRQSSV